MRERVGRYRLVSKLGAGGMGVVYRAQDERLDRFVALKLLPPQALQDDVARQRFRNEARTLCRLNHPNVATLYDFGEEDGVDFLVMELISGETLQQLLSSGPLPLPQVLSLGTQMMRGLAAAHEVGIIHRDLKPGNVLVTPDGHLKIVDFGLAKQVYAKGIAASQLSTDVLATAGVTGTLPYMAPEHLRGEPADPRLDIYGAGVVLYELLTGRLPFAEQGAMLIDAIFNRRPVAPSTVNPNVPPVLEFVVLKALEKDPAHRYQAARDLAADLQRVSSGSISLPASRATRLARRWGSTVATFTAIALVLLGIWLGSRHNTEPGRVRLEPLTSFTDAALAPALSPDGRMLAYLHTPSGNFGSSTLRFSDLYVQMLPNGEPQRLVSDDRPKNWPSFSPDGSRIAYTSNDASLVWDTWQVPVLGGDATRLLRNAAGLSWLPNGGLLYSKIVEGFHMAIATASESRTGERLVYIPVGPNSMAHRSFLSPDGKWILVVEMDNNSVWLPCRLVPFDGSSAGRAVGPPGAQCTAAAWSPDQRWMYFSSNAGGAFHLWRQRFPEGVPQQLTFGPTQEEGISMAPDGKSLVTSVGTRQSTIWIHDGGGDRQLTSQGYALHPTLSPDRHWVYYIIRSQAADLEDDFEPYAVGELWRVDTDGNHAARVLPGVLLESYSLSRDGQKVLYTTPEHDRSSIWIADLEHRSPPRRLIGGGTFAAFFGASGEIVFMSATNVSEPHYLMRMDEDGGNLRKVIDHPILYLMSLSPKGDWALVTMPTGHGEATTQLYAVSLRDAKSILLCDVCIIGTGPVRLGAPAVAFSPDQKWMYISLQYVPEHSSATAVLQMKAGVPFNFVRNGKVSAATLTHDFGARIINEKDMFPGADSSTYLVDKMSSQANIYRVILPD